MEFCTKYVRPKEKGEKGGGPKIVETAGYISAEKRIKALIDAGQRLVDYRMMMYDAQPGSAVPDNEIYPDPTRSGNFDFADATQIANQVEANLRRQKNAADEAQKKAADAKKQADQGLDNPPVGKFTTELEKGQ